MTSRKPLRMLLAVALFLILSVPLIVAVEPANEVAKDQVAVSSCQRCGDGYCAPSCENERTCPADCRQTKAAATAAARCGRCGDGQCVKSCGETSVSCPVDCGGGGEPSATRTAKP